jgi:fumarate hydratase subunit alpha
VRAIVRQISVQTITDAVAGLCVRTNYALPPDVLRALEVARQTEPSSLGRHVLSQLLENARIADQGAYPLCQDTGLIVVWLDLGQEVHLSGGDLGAAIQEGVRRGHAQGYLRASIVDRPYSARKNSGDNTPAVIHTQIVPGEHVRVAISAKGGGSENMSALRMLTPADGRDGVVEFVTGVVERAGANPCPPVIVGVGIGGSAEHAMLMAKRSLLRPVGQPHPDAEIADLEQEILTRVNDLGIGPEGLGGRTTALAVHIETHPCHIASLPVGVNLQCHSARHEEVIL